MKKIKVKQTHIKKVNKKATAIILVTILSFIAVAAVTAIIIVSLMRTNSRKASISNLTGNYLSTNAYAYVVYENNETNEKKYIMNYANQITDDPIYFEVYNPYGRKLNIVIENYLEMTNDELKGAIEENLVNEHNYSQKALSNTKINIYSLKETHELVISDFIITDNNLTFKLIIDGISENIIANYKLEDADIYMDYVNDNIILREFFTKGSYSRIEIDDFHHYSRIIFKNIVILDGENQ